MQLAICLWLLGNCQQIHTRMHAHKSVRRRNRKKMRHKPSQELYVFIHTSSISQVSLVPQFCKDETINMCTMSAHTTRSLMLPVCCLFQTILYFFNNIYLITSVCGVCVQSGDSGGGGRRHIIITANAHMYNVRMYKQGLIELPNLGIMITNIKRSVADQLVSQLYYSDQSDHSIWGIHPIAGNLAGSNYVHVPWRTIIL